MNVLSLFDGMSCGQIALRELGIKVDRYYASEINKHAIKQTQLNFPDTIQLGDVTKVNVSVISYAQIYKYLCNEISDLQSRISEREMLHRLDFAETFCAYIPTPLQSNDTQVPEHTILCNDECLWFFRNPMDGTCGIFDVIRSGERRNQPNQTPFNELLKHSFWWNGYGQQEPRAETARFARVDGTHCYTKNETETEGCGNPPILNSVESSGSTGTGIKAIQRPSNESENATSQNCINATSNCVSFENRVKETECQIRKDTEPIQQWSNKNDRNCETDGLLLSIRKETQATVVKCEWGLIVFKGEISLCVAGSPCQGFSFAGRQLNFNDPRSALFFEFVRILKECREINPDVKFMLENVRMKREYEQVISDTLGIKPVMINSALVSAQNRVRLYWSNIRTAPDGLFEIKTDIPQPQDRGLFLRDIIEDDVDEKWFLSQKMIDWLNKHSNKRGVPIRLVNGYCKSSCLTATAQVKQNLTTDYLIAQRPRGNNKGGTFTDKSPTLSANAWEQNNILCISSNQAHATVSVNKSTPLVAAMGMGGGHVPMVVKREVKQVNPCTESGGKQPYQQNRVYDADGIMPSLCSAHAGHAPLIACDEVVRRITPTEAARLQTIPDWYKWECSATQQYTMLGNGWTVEVIKHIFSFLNQ